MRVENVKHAKVEYFTIKFTGVIWSYLELTEVSGH